MASFCHGGDAIVSAKVQLGDGGSVSAIAPRGLKIAEGGKDSANGFHGNIVYDSSSSPYDMSPLGDNDSDYGEEDDDSVYGEKDDEKNNDALALARDEVIEDISPLARDDGSVSSFIHAKGMFSKASFGVISDNSCVRILKRDPSATVSPSFTSSLGGKMEVNDGALGDGVWGQNGNSRGLPIMVENMNSKIPNQINDANLLPCLNSNLSNYDQANLESVDVNGVEFGNSDLSYSNLSVSKRDFNLPHLDSSLLVNGAGDNIANKCDGVNGRVHFGKSDLNGGCNNANKSVAFSRRVQFGKSDCNSNLIDSGLECNNGDLISNDKVSHVAILGTSMNGNNSLVSLNLADENGGGVIKGSENGKLPYVTNANCGSVSEVIGVNCGSIMGNKSGLIALANNEMQNFSKSAHPLPSFNGRFLSGNNGLSPNVVEANMESFKCDFPSLNGKTTHGLNVMDLNSKKRVVPNLNFKYDDVACGKVADVACGKVANVACDIVADADKSTKCNNVIGASSYAKALGVSCGDDFQIPSSKSVTLEFIQPSVIDGRIKVCPPVDVAEEGSECWRTTLVGYFVGKRLPFKVVDSIAHKIWGRYGLREVLSSDNGFFFFKFDNVQDACVVMERGPWHMTNRPLVLKHWQPSLPLAKEDVNKVPVWVRLYNVPFEYWTSKGLSYVASAVGCPLHADHITLSRTRLSYARVCVEIDARDALIEDFDFQCSNGRWIKIRTEFEWVPLKCSSCGVFGHTLGTCPRNTSKQDEGAKCVVPQEGDSRNQFAREGGKLSTAWVPKTRAPPLTTSSQVEKDTEWVTVSRKNKGKGVMKEDAMVPFEELVLDPHCHLGVSKVGASKGLEIVVADDKEEGECSLKVQSFQNETNEINVVSGVELSYGEGSEPKLDDSTYGVDDVASLGKVFVPKPGEDDTSPIPTIHSLALKAKDSFEKNMGKVGKAKKASGGKKGRRSHSPRGGKRR